ncbi:hypothetical protein SAMN05660485_03340 [Blastococcus fimeti]|nr:hypothetical protein SAMN05660485_03340 [Blastococcus fimeti]
MRRGVLGTAAATVAVVGLPAFAMAAPPTAPFIAEIHYDNDGADVGEFIEIQLPAGTTSAGLSVVLYNGSNGQSYSTRALPAVTAPADGPAVAVLDYPANGIQNGAPDAIALVAADGTVIEFLSYEGTLTATNGPAAGTTSTDIGVAEAGSEPVGSSLSRTYDVGTGTLTWSGPAPSTRGTVNPAGGEEPGGEEPGGEEPGGEACETEPTHRIGQVQGAGDTTPLAGQAVTIAGVVVGDVEGFNGFYLQDVEGDGNAATSDGIFVYSPAAVDLGDSVAVTGTPGEFGGQTQINGGSTVTVCADGTEADLPEPAPLDLPADDATREPLEGMLVAPVDTLTVSEVYDLTSFGELTLSEGGILVQPTELARPGAEAEAIAGSNAARRIVLDDGVTARVSPATAPYLTPETPVRVGDQLAFASPLVLGYGFDNWRLQPADGTAGGTFAPQNTRPAAPESVGGDIQVGAFNVLNYFLTFGGEGRGATNAAELEEQAAKIVTAINTMDADVLALMEIEDTDSTGLTPGNADTAVADLVRRLNTAAGAEKWAFTAFPDELLAVDRDVIRNAIIYQPTAVTPVGDSAGLVDEVNFDNAREPIAQTFEADGDTFTAIANHFKSKGSGDGANADQGDGQGASNLDRQGQAEALAGFVEDLQASTGDDDVMVLGDLNAYSQEDPIVILREAGLTDLGTQFDAGRYSYVFDDMSGSLDHAMATDSLTAKVTDAAHWNINSVESFAYQYTGADRLYAPNQFRSSDHDPILVGLDLQGEPEPEPEPEVGNPTGVASGNSWVHPQDKVAYVAGHFVNTDDVAVQVRLLTDHGQSEPQTVAPGAAGYFTVNTRLAELPAGTATLRVYKFVGGQGYQSLFPVSYPGRSAAGAPQPSAGNPTGVANGNSWVHPQEQVAYIAGHFVNTDSVPVQVRMLTDHGQSVAQTVAPGAAGYFVVNTQQAELSAGTATFRVYKNVAGKGYQSLFTVDYPGQSAAGE